MKRIIFIMVLVLGSCFYFVTDNKDINNDYYSYVNKKFLSRDHLGDSDYIYSTFTKAQEESEKVRDDIIDKIISDEIKINGSEDDIKRLYYNSIDIDERNRVGLGVLDSYIDKFMNSKNIDEFIGNVIEIENELGIDILMNVTIDKDFVNNKRNIIYLYPVSFAFGSSVDYYVDEDYMAYLAYIKRAIINLLEVYGMSKSEARLVSNEVVSFYVDISKSSKLSSSYEDVTNYYNIVDINYLSNLYSNLDVNKYLNDRGIYEKEFSLVDEGQYSKINDYLSDEYLLLWKKVALVEVLSSYASYLSSSYRDVVVDLNNSLTGSNNDKGIEDDTINLVGSVFSNEIDRIYESIVITNGEKDYLRNLFFDIKKYFKKMIKDNSWLSSDTKDKALVKLDAMEVFVGLDGVDSLDSNLVLEGDNLVNNIVSINKSNYLSELSRLKDNSDVRALSEVMVNAYYNPISNAVYIPSSVMFLLDDNDSYYERLGTIGMIIAHEIVHGFDYNGSLFDDEGNLNNWWSDLDRSNYAKLRDEVISYYSKIKVIDGKFIDGDKTVNENIADIGAVKTITGVALDEGASDEELKVMYSSFARFWRSQETDDYTKLLLLNDSHSPNKYRVNAVLSLIDEFYKVYSIYPWNDMYIYKRKRVSVW